MPNQRPTLSLRPYTALTHTVSQLTRRPLPNTACRSGPHHGADPDLAFTKHELSRPLQAWTQTDWEALINAEVQEPSGLLPWLAPLLERTGLTPRPISLALYNHLQACHDAGAHYVLQGDGAYPRLLTYLDDAPLALSLLGSLELLEKPCLSIVGSRKASAFALNESRRLGRRLAQLGIVAVSGGAYGCDIAVHQGVATVAESACLAVVVLAGGLQRLYPRGNAGLMNWMLQRGALLVSERLWGCDTRPYDFPVRNRIIAGLAWELVVMQAGLKSGAMVTARCALDQGREVLVLRHPQDDVRADGSWQLLRDGAYAFADSDELMCSYRFYHERGGEHGCLA